jgi:hypothetical protein
MRVVPRDRRHARQGPARARSHARREPPWLGAGACETPSRPADWIANPQKYQAGVNMPPLAAAPNDLAAISAYLGMRCT